MTPTECGFVVAVNAHVFKTDPSVTLTEFVVAADAAVSKEIRKFFLRPIFLL